MRAFATLLDRLVLTPSRNGKLKLLADYFASVPDPDRGYALGVLAGTLDLKTVKPALLKELVLERMDQVLFGYSYDYVGDLAETISLVWDQDRGEKAEIAEPSLGEVVALMQSLGRTQVRVPCATCSTSLTRLAALPFSNWRPAACGSGSLQGLPNKRLPRCRARMSVRSRRCGMGWSHPM